MAIIDISVVQYLPITQGDAVQDSSIPVVCSQSLSLVQDVHCSIQNQNTNQPFNVQQAVAVGKVLNLSVATLVNLTQLTSPTYYLEAQNVVHFTQQAANVNPQQIYQSIHVTQSVVPARALGNTLTIAQVIGVVGIYNPTESTSLAITQTAAYFKTDAVNTYGISVPDPIDPIPIVLTYGARTLTLKIPEIGDTDKIEVDRVQEQTRGGDLIVFRDPIWPITETLKYKFINLTRQKAQQLLSFFTDTIGLSIQLTDHQGVIWDGIITTPETEVICTNDNNCGSYEVEFEFQGEMQ